MTNQLPDWSRRMILHDAARSLGLPWMPSAIVPGATRPAMTYGENIAAIDLTMRLVKTMRGELPRGVSGAAVDNEQVQLAHKLALAIVACRSHVRDDEGDDEEDDQDDDDRPPVAVVQVGPKPRGPAPSGVAVTFTQRKGGRPHGTK